MPPASAAPSCPICRTVSPPWPCCCATCCNEDQPAGPDDLSDQRLRFGQLFLRHLDALGRPFLPGGQPLITAADYLEMLELGEMLAERDHSFAANPAYATGSDPSGSRPRGRFRVPAQAAGKRRTYDRTMRAPVEVPEG